MPISLALLVFAAAPLACAGGKSAEERQLDELREEISHVQSESDKFEERLDKLEVDSADSHVGSRATDSSAMPAHALSAPIATPQLRVVHLQPDGTEESGSAGETAGAVEKPTAEDGEKIRIQGSGEAVTVTEKGKPRRLQDSTASNGTASFTNANIGSSLASHSGLKVSAVDQDAKHAYDAALALVNAKHYPEALDALAGFLVRWPDHPNADNAMYWRGECYFAQGDYTSAEQEFEGLIARFPAGNKAPDALLKLGLSEQRLDNASAARAHFDRLRRDFPHSDAARRIPAGAQTVRPDPAPPARSTSGDKQ